MGTDAIGQAVKDIIDLKMECSNMQQDADMEKLYNWYSWGLESGHVIVDYKYGELQGFIEWVRLKEIPETRNDAVDSLSWEDNGYKPILYVGNCCIRDDGKKHLVMWKLVHMMREQNEGFEHVCWHEGDNDKLVLWDNAKKMEGVKQ